jgi:hypothetical protein
VYTFPEGTMPEIMLSTLQQRAVWEGMLGAEIRANYFADLAGRYQQKQRLLTWGTLLFSSGAFATIISDWLPQDLRWIRAAAALMAAALSLWSLTAKNERTAIECSDLHFKWNRLAREFDRLWNDMYTDSAADTLWSLQEKAGDIAKSCTSLPNKERLMVKWEKRVILDHQAA